MRRSLRIRVLICGLLCVLAGSQSLADITSGSWYMDRSNTFPDDVDYGRVDITADSDTGEVQFHVVAFTVPYYEGLGDNPGLQKFGFNYTGVFEAPSDWAWTLPSDWSMDTGRNQDGFGEFQVLVESGEHGYRQDPLDFSLTLPSAGLAVVSNFTVLSTGTAGEGNVYFAAHYAGFSNPPGSHFIGGSTPVPEPASGAALLGAIGLFAAGALRRRIS